MKVCGRREGGGSCWAGAPPSTRPAPHSAHPARAWTWRGTPGKEGAPGLAGGAAGPQRPRPRATALRRTLGRSPACLPAPDAPSPAVLRASSGHAGWTGPPRPVGRRGGNGRGRALPPELRALVRGPFPLGSFFPSPFPSPWVSFLLTLALPPSSSFPSPTRTTSVPHCSLCG